MKRKIILALVAASAASFGCNESSRGDSCGDGILGDREICDGTLFHDGMKAFCPNGAVADNALVRCTSSCALDMTLACSNTQSVCGNGAREAGEDCDGTIPAVVAGCDNPDFSKLSCKNCKLSDAGVCPKTSADGACGNGIAEDGELCDGDDVPAAARVCPENMVLAANPYFKCADSCQLVDVSQACVYGLASQCGNGRLDPGEQCDGALFDEDTDYSVNCAAGKVYDSSRVVCDASCRIDATAACVDVPYSGVMVSELVPAVEDGELAGIAIEVANRGTEKIDMSSYGIAIFSAEKIEKIYSFPSLGLNELGGKQVYVVCSRNSSSANWGNACDFDLSQDDISANLTAQTTLIGIVRDADAGDETATDGKTIVDLVNVNSFLQAIAQGGAVDFIRLCKAKPHTAAADALMGDGWSITALTNGAPEYDLGAHCSGESIDGKISSCKVSISRNALTSRDQSVEIALETKIAGITDKTDKTDDTKAMRVEFFSGKVSDGGTVKGPEVNHYVLAQADAAWTNADGYDRYVGTLRNWETYEGFWSDEQGTYVVDAGITFDNGETYTYCGKYGVLADYAAYDSAERETLTVKYEAGTCGNGIIEDDEVCDGSKFLDNALFCDKDGEIILDPSRVMCGNCQAAYTGTACGKPLPNCNGEALDAGEVCDGSHIPDEAKVCDAGETVSLTPQWACGSTCAYVDKSKACEKACGNDRLDEKVEGQNAEICDGAIIPDAAKVCPKGMVEIDNPVWACNDACSGIDETRACEKACGNGKLDASVSGQKTGEVCEGDLFAENIAEQCGKERTYEASRKSCTSACKLDAAACIPSQQLVFDEYAIVSKPGTTLKGMALSINLYGAEAVDVTLCNVSILDKNGKTIYSKYTKDGAQQSMVASYGLTEIGKERIEVTEDGKHILKPCEPLVICSIPADNKDDYNYFEQTAFGGKCDASLSLPESDTKLNGDYLISRMDDIYRIQLTCGGEYIDFVDYKGLGDAYKAGKIYGKLKESDRRPWSGSDSVVHADRFELADTAASAESFAAPTCGG